MSKNQTKRYIDRWKRYYKGIGVAYCKYLQTTIHFNSQGFNHLIYKRGHRRSLKEIYNRLPLLKYAKTVVKSARNISSSVFKDETFNGKTVQSSYVALIFEIDRTKKIKVILRKRGSNGQWFFQSIMRIRTKSSKQKSTL